MVLSLACHLILAFSQLYDKISSSQHQFHQRKTKRPNKIQYKHLIEHSNKMQLKEIARKECEMTTKTVEKS